MARPGIMLYFEILEPIRMLSDADKGRLLVAILEYGRDGVVPELEGPLGIVWSFVHPMIDKDGQRYDDMKLQREYAAFCKKRKRIWMPKIAFDDWIVMTDNERERAVDPVASRYPTTTSTTTPTTANNDNIQRTTTTNNIQLQLSTSTNNSHLQGKNTAATAGDNVDVVGGQLGKGVVFLADAQIEDLLEQMGREAFDYYLDKLSSFIIENDAKVANHYATILKWWREDSGLERR